MVSLVFLIYNVRAFIAIKEQFYLDLLSFLFIQLYVSLS